MGTPSMTVTGGRRIRLGAIFEHPALGAPARRIFWAMVAVGVLARVVVAFATLGDGFDINSYEVVRTALHHDPLHVYALVNRAAPHWPYPPGFFPWIVASGAAHRLTGLRFDGFVQLAPIAADLGLAWLVQAYLARRGASDRTRLVAAALVVFGPVFAVTSGYHGQLDSLAILPAVAGFCVWSDRTLPRRALVAGLLIGAGAAIKEPAGLLVLALLPSARSRREAATLAAAAAAVPLLLLVPFFAADLHGTLDGLRGNRGLPGFGGISLLVQPNLSALWLGTAHVTLSPTSRALFDHGTVFALGMVLVTAAVMAWRRAQPPDASVLLFLTFYAFGINFGISYLIWGMPFLLMSGRLRAVAALQAALLVPLALLYIRIGRGLPLQVVYTPIMLAIWVALVAAWLSEMGRMLRPWRSRSSAAMVEVG